MLIKIVNFDTIRPLMNIQIVLMLALVNVFCLVSGPHKALAFEFTPEQIQSLPEEKYNYAKNAPLLKQEEPVWLYAFVISELSALDKDKAAKSISSNIFLMQTFAHFKLPKYAQGPNPQSKEVQRQIDAEMRVYMESNANRSYTIDFSRLDGIKEVYLSLHAKPLRIKEVVQANKVAIKKMYQRTVQSMEMDEKLWQAIKKWAQYTQLKHDMAVAPEKVELPTPVAADAAADAAPEEQEEKDATVVEDASVAEDSGLSPDSASNP